MDDLNTLLEERVADVPVGAPPIDAMRAAVRRRRSRMTVLGAAAAVAAIAAGGIVWQQVEEPDTQLPVASDPLADLDAPPNGYRYVGIRGAAIAIPEEWSTNDTRCGTPVSDTVVIDNDLEISCMMWVERPADVESVTIQTHGTNIGGGVAPRVGKIDGEQAGWTPIVTEDGVSSGAVTLVDRGVTFVAESSSADGEAIVEDLLSGIAILDHVTVPDIQGKRADEDAYVARLYELGISAEVVWKRSPLPHGTVLSTDPAVGTVVSSGDTVTVTVAR